MNVAVVQSLVIRMSWYWCERTQMLGLKKSFTNNIFEIAVMFFGVGCQCFSVIRISYCYTLLDS